ncbi:MAG: GGDEF domain-containing protein, partial [Deltaproteobacteria bacterium]|nr:GGDEF domain-containing protein [Deltaproteobacteria bacterium]
HIFFQHESADVESLTYVHLVAPFAAVLFVAGYNAFFQYSYRWFVQIRSLNQAQLLFDLLVVTVMVHFSGGAISWFWTMYMVLTLEAALIMDKKSDTYAIALGSSIAFGGLLTFEFYRIILPVAMPFENNVLQQTYSYVMIKWAWVSITNFCVAFVAAFMMETVRRREARLRDLVVRDSLTGLYNRRYFIYRLNSEIQRAKRYGRTLSLLILDVDDFKKYNDEHGHLAGDALLRSLADILKAHIRRSDDKLSYEVDIACRYGGEEFAIILPESVSAQGMVAAERLRRRVETIGAVSVAERIRKKIEEAHHGKVHMTVSIGVSSYPEHGVEIDSLIRAADDAMYLAKRKGKNRVVVAGGDTRAGTPMGAAHG